MSLQFKLIYSLIHKVMRNAGFAITEVITIGSGNQAGTNSANLQSLVVSRIFISKKISY